MKKIKNSKGFTLMEMLIVVAIIAILVAIAIPTFTTQLEKAREAADLANLRSAYAEVIAASLTSDPAVGDTGKTANGIGVSGAAGSFKWSKEVDATKQKAEWVTSAAPKIGEVDLSEVTPVTKGSKWVVEYSEATATATIAAAKNSTGG